MLDIGMIVSGAVIAIVVTLADRWVNDAKAPNDSVLDLLYLPTLIGVVVGRLVALMLDDPTSLGSVRSILVIRGGVEFWPGVAAFGVAVTLSARRRRRGALESLVALAPFAVWGYAAYEGTCAFRDGCFGPASGIGLVPTGLSERQVPIGLLMGFALALLGWDTLRRSRRAAPLPLTLPVAVAGAASIRSIGSIWLPHLGTGLTRQHVQSLVVLVAAVTVAGLIHVRSADRAPSSDGSQHLRPDSETSS